MTTWTLDYDRYDPHQEGLREALCTTGNGYFATRGAAPFAGADGVHYPGTYIAGLYDRLETTIRGHVVANEELVNLPNWLPLTFRLVSDDDPEATDTDGDDVADTAWNDGWFDLADVDILEYGQTLDMRSGLVARRLRFVDRQDRRLSLVYRQFVSMAVRHVGALEMTLVAENWSGRVQMRSALDGQVTNSGVARYRALRGDHLVPIDAGPIKDATMMRVHVRTRQSHIRVAQAARTTVFLDDNQIDVAPTVRIAPGLVAFDYSVDLEEGQQLRAEKVITLFSSRDQAISESGEQSVRRLEVAGGFDALLADHMLAWNRIWNAHHLHISNDEHSQMVLNLHVFHQVQTVSMHSIDLDVGVPARGLHGEAYRGHIFWDELFIFPYLNVRLPELVRSLLLYRYRRLPEARRLAREAGHEGASYPWQSGSDGRETSQTLHLNPRSGRWSPDNSHLQRHINLAVAYNIWQYVQITEDTEFLAFYGGEMLLEISRFLASIASYNHALDRYEIRGVMGPDEYHEGYPWRDEPGLDNNTYTNIMTVWTLMRAMEALELLPDRRRHELVTRIRLQPDELLHWEDISRKMRICFHGDRILSQFEGYERLKELDWQSIRASHGDIARLDRILEAEGDSPNRYKASKQADVLMLFYLFPQDELRGLLHRLGHAWDADMASRTIDYYFRRTSHGSTLSAVVHSWVLARLDRKRSFDLFRQALESDVGDVQGGTTQEGIHLGAMAGTVDLVQRGYTGLLPRGDVLWFDPMLPAEIDRLQFTIRYRRAWDVLFDIDRERIRVTTPAGSTIKVGYDGRVTEVAPGTTTDIELSAASDG
ncbi:MAG TPA: glycosyl hydrolase family 65 protein [Euzebyales bacterium]|nr:glycosyl hydrolase family 65 protein [Euzebyales bacterium]